MLLNYKRKLSKIFWGEEGEKTYINGSNLVKNELYKNSVDYS